MTQHDIHLHLLSFFQWQMTKKLNLAWLKQKGDLLKKKEFNRKVLGTLVWDRTGWKNSKYMTRVWFSLPLSLSPHPPPSAPPLPLSLHLSLQNSSFPSCILLSPKKEVPALLDLQPSGFTKSCSLWPRIPGKILSSHKLDQLRSALTPELVTHASGRECGEWFNSGGPWSLWVESALPKAPGLKAGGWFHQCRDQQTCSVKSPIINILAFEEHIVSVYSTLSFVAQKQPWTLCQQMGMASYQ